MWFTKKTPTTDDAAFKKAVNDEITARVVLAKRKTKAKLQAVKNLTNAKKTNSRLLADARKKLCPYIDGQKLCVADGCHAWAGDNSIVTGELVRYMFATGWGHGDISVSNGGHCNFKGAIK